MQIVIFTGGIAPEPEKTVSYFKQTGLPDLVIAADSGLETLEKYNIFFAISEPQMNLSFMPKYILGDMDSIKNKNLIEKYKDSRMEKFPEDKDFSDTELALKKACNFIKEKCIPKNSAVITLVGGDGGRIDHFIGILETFSSAERPDVWLCREQRVYLLEKNDSIIIKNLVKKDNISIYNTANENNSFETKGLEWPENTFRNTRMPSLSNRISSDFEEKKLPVEIKTTGNDCIIILPYSGIPEVIKSNV